MLSLRSFAAAALVLTGAASAALAQDGASFEAKLAAKKGEAWFTSSPWTDDYDAARAQAKETGKPILAYFTRSYAP